MGLAMLFEAAGFSVLEVGQWGNFDYIQYIFQNHSWPDYWTLRNLGNGKILNEEKNVAQCWCLVQKT